MTTTACDSKTDHAETHSCPVSGFPGEPVEWLTVAALASGPVPSRQEFWLCRDPACETVYFGSAGALLERAELTVQPGFKAGSTGLLCYCFQHRRDEITCELEASGRTRILDVLRAKMRVGQCACQVRNPSGKCCLGDIQRIIRDFKYY
jgi:hypothetical protein